MSSLPHVPPTAIFALSLFLVYVTYQWAIPKPQRLPPGPKPSRIPLVGNVRQIKSLTIPLYTWAGSELRKKYGDVISLNVLGKRTIVLNNLKAMSELFSREVYSDRPFWTMGGEIMGAGETTALVHYGSEWKTHRRLYQHLVGSGDLSRTWVDLADDETRALTGRLASETSNALEDVKLTLVKWVLRLTYGMPVNSLGDKYVRTTESTSLAVSASFRPGAYMVDIFPILKYVPAWFPGAGWKVYGQDIATNLNIGIQEPYEAVESALAQGQDVPDSLTSIAIQENLANRDTLMLFTGSVYATGVHTTMFTLRHFVALMLLHPDIQARAQKEIDGLLHGSRLPNLEDKASLPYVDALIQEVFRWESIVPLSVPHRVMEDDVYQGMLIPKGSTIMANLWTPTRDPDIYTDPDVFNPERFLGPKPPLDPRSYSFGLGRRICPGKSMAETITYLVIVRILAAYTISKPLDSNGKEYMPDVILGRWSNTHGIANFPVRMVPRSEKHAA